MRAGKFGQGAAIRVKRNMAGITAFTLALLVLSVSGPAFARPPAITDHLGGLDRRELPPPELVPSKTSRLLTGPSAKPPAQIVLEYLREHGETSGVRPADLDDLKLVARDVSPDGITHLRFNQVLSGIESFDHGIDAHVTGDGRLIEIESSVVSGAELTGLRPGLGARGALREAREAISGEDSVPPVTESGSGAGRTTSFASGETTELRWSDGPEGPSLAWQSITETPDGRLYDVLVAADDGEVLRRQSLTPDLGENRYYPLDPDQTPVRTQLTMPPEWYDDHGGGTRLWGENARTYTDSNNENPAAGNELGGTRVQIAASNGNPVAPDWLYTPSHDFPGATPCPSTGCTWDSDVPRSEETNQLQAGSNLHVLVNRFHDHLERAPIGFDEAAGNFQLTNPTGQGLGGDYVRAEVNDGDGINNANMSTPPDGQAPRMQMFLFNRRDVNGADAADVVYHEYTHGLSYRLVVNSSGSAALNPLQSRMMGEGWSDFYAMDLIAGEGSLPDTSAPGELTTGNYVVGPPGIRAKPIDCPVNPEGVAGCNGTRGAPVAGGFTYGDLPITVNTTPHNGGEIWAQTLWDIRSALGRTAALKLVTGGMRLTTENPSMLDARDGILRQAVATRSAAGAPDDFYSTLWSLFAARGMGAGATTPDAESTDPAESYELPAGIRTGATTFRDPYPGGDDDGVIEAGERFLVDQAVEGIGPADLPGVTGTLTSTGPGVTIEDGSAAWPLLGKGRVAINSDELAARLPAGVCSAPVPLTIAVRSSEGDASATAVVDPRPGSSEKVAIPEPGGTVESPELRPARAGFTVPSGGAITDVDLRIDELRHYYLGDLVISLEHDGVKVEITDQFGDPGFDGKDIIDAVFDDEAAAPPSTAGSPVTGRVRPSGALAAFDGHPAAGLWTLEITDTYPDAQNGGELRKWGIDSPQAGCGRPEIPVAATGEADRISFGAATLHGAVTPNGRATGIRISYGRTTAYGATTPEVAAGAGEGPVAYAKPVGSLEPGTTYHFRVEAMRGDKVAVAGEDREFTTKPAPPPHIDVTPPAITGPFKVKRKRATNGGRRRVTLGFSLSEPARVRVKLTRALRGIRRDKRCLAPKGRRGKRCVRQVRAGSAAGTFRTAGPATLSLSRRGLVQGRYTARLVATDPSGNRSQPKVVRFTVR